MKHRLVFEQLKARIYTCSRNKQKKKVYAFFIDKAAFDSVNRGKLWKCLERRDIRDLERRDKRN